MKPGLLSLSPVGYRLDGGIWGVGVGWLKGTVCHIVGPTEGGVSVSSHPTIQSRSGRRLQRHCITPPDTHPSQATSASIHPSITPSIPT